MLEEYKGFLSLDELLEKEYHYTYDEKNRSDFLSKPFVHLEVNGRTALCWITYKGEEYLFKPLEEFRFNVWGELLSCAYAKMLEIPCANYRACRLGNEWGVLTQKIQKESENLVLGCEIIQRFFNEYPYKKEEFLSIFANPVFLSSYEIPESFLKEKEKQKILLSYLNNLDHIWSIFSVLKSDNEKSLIIFFTKMLLFEILTLQADCNVNNWGVIEKDGKFFPAKLFDQMTSFGLGYYDMEKRANNFRNEQMNARFLRNEEPLKAYVYQGYPLFTLTNQNVQNFITGKKDSHLKVLADFLEMSSEEYQELFFQYFEKINEISFSDVVAQVEKENGLTMDDDVYAYISSVFNFQIKNIKKNIEKKKEGNLYVERRSL